MVYNENMDPKQENNQNSPLPQPSEFYAMRHEPEDAQPPQDTLTDKLDTYTRKLPGYLNPKIVGSYVAVVIVLSLITSTSPLFVIVFSLPALIALFLLLTAEGNRLLDKVFRKKDDTHRK